MSRRWRRGLVPLAAALAVGVVVLNVSGFARYPGGPLREPDSVGPLWLDIRREGGGSSTAGFDQPDWATPGRPLYYGLLVLHNPSPWEATVEAITPIDPTPGLIVEGVWVARPGAPTTGTVGIGLESIVPEGSTFDETFIAPPAQVRPTGPTHEQDALTLLRVRIDQPGVIGFSALAVDYRLGPIAFRAIHHLGLDGCVGPLPANSSSTPD